MQRFRMISTSPPRRDHGKHPPQRGRGEKYRVGQPAASIAPCSPSACAKRSLPPNGLLLRTQQPTTTLTIPAQTRQLRFQKPRCFLR